MRGRIGKNEIEQARANAQLLKGMPATTFKASKSRTKRVYEKSGYLLIYLLFLL